MKLMNQPVRFFSTLRLLFNRWSPFPALHLCVYAFTRLSSVLSVALTIRLCLWHSDPVVSLRALHAHNRDYYTEARWGPSFRLVYIYRQVRDIFI